jgi:hypothetical protein
MAAPEIDANARYRSATQNENLIPARECSLTFHAEPFAIGTELDQG